MSTNNAVIKVQESTMSVALPSPEPAGTPANTHPPRGQKQLKVLEAYTKDAGLGRARIDYDTMDALDASTGDIIEIRGTNRRTVAVVLPVYPSDARAREIIRMDNLIRGNAGVTVGDTVTVRKVKLFPAEIVTVVPQEATPTIDGNYLARALNSFAATIGDEVSVPYFGGRLGFKVSSHTPLDENGVFITAKTLFVIHEGEKKTSHETTAFAGSVFLAKMALRSEKSEPIQGQGLGKLKATIPKNVSEALGIVSGDKLNWSLVRIDDGTWLAVVGKIRTKQTIT